MDSASLVALITKHLQNIRDGNADQFEEEAKKAGVKLDAEKIAAFQSAIRDESAQVRLSINCALCEAHLVDTGNTRERLAAYTDLKTQYRAAGYDRLI